MVRHFVLIPALAGAAFAQAQAADNMDVQFHGFASQGYFLTRNNALFTPDSQDKGTFEFDEVGLNVVATPVERLRVGIQIFAQDFGDSFNNKPQIDWAYGDYSFPTYGALDFGVTAGRLKMNHGLYNDYRDLDMTRTSVFLPMTVYNPRLRDYMLSVNGLGAHGTVNAAAFGSFDVTTFIGAQSPDPHEGTIHDLFTDLGVDVNTIHIEAVDGGQPHLEHPGGRAALQVLAVQRARPRRQGHRQPRRAAAVHHRFDRGTGDQPALGQHLLSRVPARERHPGRRGGVLVPQGVAARRRRRPPRDPDLAGEPLLLPLRLVALLPALGGAGHVAVGSVGPGHPADAEDLRLHRRGALRSHRALAHQGRVHLAARHQPAAPRRAAWRQRSSPPGATWPSRPPSISEPRMDTQKPPLLRLSALLAVVLACTARCAQGAEDAVVVNGRAAIAELSDEDLRDLFLGKKTVWDDGTKVVVVVLKTGPSHDALLRRLGRNPQQFLTGWKKLVFTGKSGMPEQVGQRGRPGRGRRPHARRDRLHRRRQGEGRRQGRARPLSAGYFAAAPSMTM